MQNSCLQNEWKRQSYRWLQIQISNNNCNLQNRLDYWEQLGRNFNYKTHHNLDLKTEKLSWLKNQIIEDLSIKHSLTFILNDWNPFIRILNLMRGFKFYGRVSSHLHDRNRWERRLLPARSNSRFNLKTGSETRCISRYCCLRL